MGRYSKIRQKILSGSSDTNVEFSVLVHPKAQKPITISGKLGDDAKHYQIRAVRLALKELGK